MKKILLLLLIILIPLVSSLVTTPSTINVDVQKGIEKIIKINITNNNVFNLSEIEIVSEYASIDKIDLVSGETKTVDLKILADDVGDLTEIATLRGYRKIPCFTQTHQINISSLGLNPSSLKICLNDQVAFTNYCSHSIYLTIFKPNYVNVYMDINQTKTYPFPNIGTHSVVVSWIGDGIIEVVEEELLVHSNEDDFNLTLNIKSILEETNLTVTLDKTDFTINFDASKTSFLVIKNTGDKKAENVRLEGDWMNFDVNHFDLNIGDSKAVNFVISPYISKISDTDKTHYKELKIKADNVGEVIKNLTIYIPYSSLAEKNITSAEFWEAKREFCDENPTSIYCTTEPIIVYRNVSSYACPSILMNVSPEDVRDVWISQLRSEGSITSFLNWMKDYELSNNQTNIDIRNFMNDTSRELTEIKDESKDFKNIFLLILALFILLSILTGGGYVFYLFVIKKIRKKRGKL